LGGLGRNAWDRGWDRRRIAASEEGGRCRVGAGFAEDARREMGVALGHRDGRVAQEIANELKPPWLCRPAHFSIRRVTVHSLQASRQSGRPATRGPLGHLHPVAWRPPRIEALALAIVALPDLARVSL
jgi:hypothetical protein